jgi:hypothetical protein
VRPKALLLYAVSLLLGVGVVGANAGSEKSGFGSGDDSSGQKLPNDAPIIQLSAASDTKNAKLSLTFNLRPPPAGEDQATSQFLSIVGATPLVQGQNYSNFATLDALTQSTSLTLKYLYAASKSRAVTDRTSPVFLAECYSLLAKVKGDVQRACTVGRVQAALTKLEQSGNVSEATKKEINEGIADLSKMQKPVLESMWLWGINGTTGYDQHKFFDPATLGSDSLTKLSFDVGASLAYVFENGHASVNFSADYQSAYKDNGSGKIQCKTTTAPITSCVSGFIGSPNRTDRTLLSTDLRFIVSPLGFPIGFDPKVTYDAHQRSEAVQFPIYFISDASGGLAGGIRYDWNSEKHISVIGIFASAAFDVVDTGG